MKTVAFVPLRLNSQRVAGKNLRLLGGEPLMCHILRTLAGIGEIDEVYAYCSDERICEYLPRSVRFLRRSPGLDRDTTLGREIYDSFTADVEADLYVLAHATSPFIRAETVADALRHVRSGEYDSAFSAEKIQTFAWFEGRPLNYALDDIPRTQTIEPVYIETSAFFIFPRTLWCGRGRRIGEKPYMAVVDRIEGLGAVRILSCFPINLSNTWYLPVTSFSYVLLRLIGKHDRIRTAPSPSMRSTTAM